MAVPLRAGDVVVDKYRIERQLGSGGMGIVLEATHLQLNQPVALKFLVDSGLEPAVAAERFLREARATFRLRSEHTVRMMDVGTLPTGEPFIVMEMLVGKDFKQLIADRGPLPAAEASLYMLQVCNALQEAHALGIVHRDLKARNLYLIQRVDGTPCVKVLDFGISKFAAELDQAPLTQPDMGMGSPRYMAPEQWTSAATVDARADIYAAGCVFYELLTGQSPLAGMPLVEVIKRIRAGAVPSPKEIRPDLPEAVCRVVMKALRPRPEERFPSALHFAQAIRDAQPEAEAKGRPKAIMAMTVPTAVVNREVLLARAQLDAHFAKQQGPMSDAPTPPKQPTPNAPPTDPDSQSLSSTLNEGGPAVSTDPIPRTPPTRLVPQATQQPPSMAGDDFEDIATVVTKSAMDDDGPYSEPRNQHATLQVAEIPPEIQALRNKMYPPAQSGAPPPQPVLAMRAPAPPHNPRDFIEPTVDDALGSRSRPMLTPSMRNVPAIIPPPPSLPHMSRPSEPIPQPPRTGIPPWLFWLLLVISFCFAGGIAAALLTRYLQ